MYSRINYKNIKVSYHWRLNGGGIILAHEFVHIISRRIGKVEHVFEYCAGPGFIGFCLLANNLCDKLTLADVNPKAIAAIQETIKNNNLQDRVSVFQSDCLESIAQTEQWDIVVGNPPWYLCPQKRKNIMVCDPEGRVHENFYRNIHKFLKPNGKILFVEGGEYSNAAYFKDMTQKNGLSITALYRVASLKDVFENLGEYRSSNRAMALCVRLGLFLRQVYFVGSEKKKGGLAGPVHSAVKDAPKTYSEDEAYSQGEIIQIARKQEFFCWLFMALVIAFLIPRIVGSFTIIACSILVVFTAFQWITALRKKGRSIYLVGMVIPVVNVFIVLYLNYLSTKILVTNNMKVGLMGAKNIPSDEKAVFDLSSKT